MMPAEFFIPYLISNLFSLALLLTAFKWPRVVRILFVILLGGGGLFNTYTAITTPETYLWYSEYAIFGFYRDFIDGFFSENLQWIVLMIAAGQITCALLLTRRGRLLKLGVMGGITFLIAIIPLGIGSAFPSTLLMAAALYVAYTKLDSAGHTITSGRPSGAPRIV